MQPTSNQDLAHNLIKWILIIVLIGVFCGLASALFLVSLNWVTDFRESHKWIIAFLPLAGLLIGTTYHKWGKSVAKGNNLILEEFENPKKAIDFRMAPMILITTIITHLFGGSAGREGTAVQMGGAIADRFTQWFNLSDEERKTILILGISGGFASVFGTPLTAGVFAIEILYFSSFRYQAIIPSFLVAFIANNTVELFHIKHTIYHIPFVPNMNLTFFLWTILLGALFGLSAMLFAQSTHFWNRLFSKKIAFPPFRSFVGGIVIALAIWLMGSTKFIGLGIPTIIDSFEIQQPWYSFLIKILLTSFTLGAGFKGGEVTPLFFVGATLGSALSLYIPLPIALLAGIGFIAVFSGATHTPIACTIMGMELFGHNCGLYIAVACIVAYFCSGSTGIYQSQILGGPKTFLYNKFRNNDMENL